MFASGSVTGGKKTLLEEASIAFVARGGRLWPPFGTTNPSFACSRFTI